jgi:hypothetical protein
MYNYKYRISKICLEIVENINEIKKLTNNLSTENNFITSLEIKRQITSLYSQTQELMLQKECILNILVNDVDSYHYYLKYKYNDDLSLGYWEKIFSLDF